MGVGGWVDAYVRVCKCVSLCVRVSECVCVRACMRACVCVWLSMSVCESAHMRVYDRSSTIDLYACLHVRL